MKKTTVKRICSIFLAVCIIFVITLSIVFTIMHAEHHCTGADCPTCHAIQMAQDILKTIGAGVAVAVFGFLANRFLSFHISSTSFEYNCTSSLLLLKVKLNN